MLEVVRARLIAALRFLSGDLKVSEGWLLLIIIALVAALGHLIDTIVTVVLKVIAEFDDLGPLLNDDMVLLAMITLARISLSLCTACPAALVAAVALLAAILARGVVVQSVLGRLLTLATFLLLALAIGLVWVGAEDLWH